MSSDVILFGAFFALRQTWELLSAATVLERAKKFSPAYGLAVFCREEIGKSELLENVWERSVAGKTVSAHDLNSGDLTNHAGKLRAAGKVLSEGIFFQGIPPDSGSNEKKELVTQMLKVNVRARELDPEKTHLSKLRAFYVGMHEAGDGWWKPWTAFDSARSGGEIDEAEAVYASRRCELEVLKTKLERIGIVLAGSLFLSPN
jgi:AbiV family abortive infection protein